MAAHRPAGGAAAARPSGGAAHARRDDRPAGPDPVFTAWASTPASSGRPIAAGRRRPCRAPSADDGNAPDGVGSRRRSADGDGAARRLPGEPIAVTPQPGPATRPGAAPADGRPRAGGGRADAGGAAGPVPAGRGLAGRGSTPAASTSCSGSKTTRSRRWSRPAPPADKGFLAGPTTRVLFGGDGLSSGTHSGGRFTAGLWLDDCQTKAIEVSGFFLPGEHAAVRRQLGELPCPGPAVLQPQPQPEFAQLTVFPGVSTGNIAVRIRAICGAWRRTFAAACAAAAFRCDDCDQCFAGWNYHVQGLAGLRYLNLNEDLTITENVINLPTAPANPNVRAVVFDDFATRNQFYGAQVGLEGEFGRGPWSLDVLGKLALGDTHQRVIINGGQQVTNLATGVTTPFRGGLLALPSNIGTHSRDAFSVVPEVNLTLNYHFNEHWRVFAGYDFLYWSERGASGRADRPRAERAADPELRPAEPTVLQRGAPPGGVVPPVRLLVQGLNLGLEFRY